MSGGSTLDRELVSTTGSGCFRPILAENDQNMELVTAILYHTMQKSRCKNLKHDINTGRMREY